jgi:hypothetical protein
MSQSSPRPPLHKGYRFPPEIISHCVWLYYRFGLSLRDVSEMMLARGAEVSHEAIRLWTLRFGIEYARRLRHTRGACSNIWHLDELCLMINRQRGWLWRAVDDAGEVLDILVIPVPKPTIIITPSPVPGKVGAQTTLTIQVTLPTGISVQDLAINFGDGTRADLGGATSAAVPHVYTTIGTFTVTVTVIDTSGQTTVGTAVVSISS